MRHARKVEVVNTPNGPVNRITTDSGLVIQLSTFRYPEIENNLELAEILAQVIVQLLSSATITLDPSTNTITIKFSYPSSS